MSTTITPDEAIQLLGLATKSRVIREIELSVAPDVTDKFLEANSMAIDALEKQIPKKPIHVRTFKNLDLAFYKCPNCGFIRRKDLFPQYCEFCGQAIDRSENNETD